MAGRGHKNTPETIISRVTKSDGCWSWDGWVGPKGYSRVRYNDKYINAHRAIYMILVGDIPEGYVIDHLCRNRTCVNPDHLEAVTNTENVMRGEGPMAVNARKTHCKSGHKFTERDVSKDGKKRGCYICFLTNQRERRRKKAALSRLEKASV
jgi:hypothetical protein